MVDYRTGAALAGLLDDYFLKGTVDNPTAQPDLLTGNVGAHCHGNEPGHHVPYLYNAAGRPDKVAETLDLIDPMYADAPEGLPGNDDVGQTSAWLVWSFLGLYPVDPCGASLHLGKPRLPRARVAVPHGRFLDVVADASCAEVGTYREAARN